MKTHPSTVTETRTDYSRRDGYLATTTINGRLTDQRPTSAREFPPCLCGAPTWNGRCDDSDCITSDWRDANGNYS